MGSSLEKRSAELWVSVLIAMSGSGNVSTGVSIPSSNSLRNIKDKVYTSLFAFAAGGYHPGWSSLGPMAYLILLLNPFMLFFLGLSPWASPLCEYFSGDVIQSQKSNFSSVCWLLSKWPSCHRFLPRVSYLTVLPVTYSVRLYLINDLTISSDLKDSIYVAVATLHCWVQEKRWAGVFLLSLNSLYSWVS